ncbi:MAG: hypothetical protein RLZZ399_38 [Verrucomicrobiota bacterium]|jgi:glycosyltransferase involved in cell wall biosynthesis
MKITLIHFTAPPAIGGVERVIGEQIRLLCSRGHRVTLCAYGTSHSTEADCFIPLDRDANADQTLAYLEGSLCGEDVVLMHNVGTMPFAPALTAALRILAARLTSARWICWVHDIACGNPDYASSMSTEVRVLMETVCVHWEYVAISERRALDLLERLGIRARVIPNGIDLGVTLGLCPQIERLAGDLEWWDADYVLLQPVRLIPRKGVERGLDLHAALWAIGCRVKYLITGAPDPHSRLFVEYSRHLRHRIEDLGIADHVHFVSDLLSVGPRQLGSLYAISDALFFPSKQEGFGLPLLESAAFRLPAFCPDIEPLRSLPGAICFPQEMPTDELAQWVIRQLEARDTISARNRLVKSFRWESIYRNFLAPLLEQPQTAQS